MPTRIAVLDRELCIRKKCGYLCANICPVNRMGDECIVVEDDTGFPAIAEKLCVGCGLCVKKCPMDAITIINLPGEEGRPLYQYGINMFRLYGLPLPQEGVSGIVGRNGIGKTTALRILSRQLKPNFAEFGEELSWDQVLERVPISVKRYFESTEEGSKVSFKVQMVERLREAFPGTVQDLLAEMDERGAMHEIVEKFGLQPILSRKTGQLSGGELQKVALAAALLKDAGIYYVDEPSNYLDIEERLRIALRLKEFGEGRRVMVVEHDLALLDYMSDYVYVFYGEENAYGMSSGAKSTRAGINEYLSGFLKEENVRFRDRELKLISFSESEKKTRAKVSYGEMKKAFGDFRFSCEGGEVREGEIVGIVGKNALGKTSFIKLIAGLEKPDEGAPLAGVKVSYKPQYIKPGPGTVEGLFANDNVDPYIYEKARREMNIEKLREKKLTSLSGGELQRVSIAYALSQKADLYLFDEPTAFLDVEQRLKFSDLLRHVISETEKSAFVVDHDVVFMDSIAQRLMVFEGKSSVEGHASAPMKKSGGMNAFLKGANITMRRDKDSKRPRINKPGSVLDREQREENRYYY